MPLWVRSLASFALQLVAVGRIQDSAEIEVSCAGSCTASQNESDNSRGHESKKVWSLRATLQAARACFWSSSARFERFWSLSDYEQLVAMSEPDEQSSAVSTELGLSNILFVVKAVHARADNVVRMERVWLHAAAFRIYLVDELIDGLPAGFQLVINDGNFEENARTGRRDAVATTRLLIWLKQGIIGHELGNLPPQTRWVVILGDDVFVNLARLYYFLVQHPAEDHPVAFAHVLSDTEVYDFDFPCIDSGAMVLNKIAFELLAETASCKECPHVGTDGIALGFCAFFNAVPLVHVPSMHCHAPSIGSSDHVLVGDPMAHHWIAGGGLSESGLARDHVQQPYHPFESNFPSYSCEAPAGLQWTAQQLTERLSFCDGGGAHDATHSLSEPLSDGASLSPESLDDYLDSRWPGSTGADILVEVPLAAGGEVADWQELQAALVDSLMTRTPSSEEHGLTEAHTWRFLRPVDTWLHRAEMGRFLRALQANSLWRSMVLGVPPLVFAFVDPDTSVLDLRAGLVVNSAAAWRLVGEAAQSRSSGGRNASANVGSAPRLEALGITVVHTPWMVPDSAALPQGLRGMVSEAAASGAWSIGRVRNYDMMDELEVKVQNRRFFARMLLENFDDWVHRGAGQEMFQQGRCRDFDTESVRAARSWTQYLHDDEEHIKTIREFKGGRREFRTLHAMYRSEVSEVLPTHGVRPETILVARDCPNVDV